MEDEYGYKTKAEAHQPKNIKEIKYAFRPHNKNDPILLTLMDSSH